MTGIPETYAACCLIPLAVGAMALGALFLLRATILNGWSACSPINENLFLVCKVSGETFSATYADWISGTMVTASIPGFFPSYPLNMVDRDDLSLLRTGVLLHANRANGRIVSFSVLEHSGRAAVNRKKQVVASGSPKKGRPA